MRAYAWFVLDARGRPYRSRSSRVVWCDWLEAGAVDLAACLNRDADPKTVRRGPWRPVRVPVVLPRAK